MSKGENISQRKDGRRETAKRRAGAFISHAHLSIIPAIIQNAVPV